jgi:hypothetical protein
MSPADDDDDDDNDDDGDDNPETGMYTYVQLTRCSLLKAKLVSLPAAAPTLYCSSKLLASTTQRVNVLVQLQLYRNQTRLFCCKICVNCLHFFSILQWLELTKRLPTSFPVLFKKYYQDEKK